MAKDQTVSVAADVLKADAAALAALAKMAGYAPANAEFALTKLQAASAANQAAADAFAQAEADWQTARDGNVAAQWAFHNAKSAVLACGNSVMLRSLLIFECECRF